MQASWDRSRHTDLVSRLVPSSRSIAGLSRQDAADLLRRYSLARRSVRLAAFDVGADTLQASFAAINARLPKIAPGEARLLVGAFGAGKSEAAETWHQALIGAFEADPRTPQPVWLDASDMTHRSLEEVLASIADKEAIRTDGLAIVIDGLDEVDGARAARLFEQGQVFVRANPNSSMLMTCRPGVIDAGKQSIDWSGLTRDEAVHLVGLVSGIEPATWLWDSILLDAISRPFFAMAAGVVLGQGGVPAGQADLIRRLVERALMDAPTTAVAVSAAPRYMALRRLARNLTESGGEIDGLDFAARALVRETTLVRSRATGDVEFSLPIFQQWFAAQSILDDPNMGKRICSDPLAFDRWRWAIAVACLAAEVDQLDDIIAAGLNGNSGAGLWVIKQISQGHDRRSESTIDKATAGARLLRATRAGVNALGELAPLYFPVASTEQPIVLGVRVDGPTLVLGWRTRSEATDEVVDLPSDVHPLNFEGDRELWLARRSGPVPDGSEWPWRLVQEDIGRQTLQILNSHPKIGPRFGIWHLESIYAAARHLGGKPTAMFEPMLVTSILEAAQRFLSMVGDPRKAAYHSNGRTIPGQTISDLVAWLAEQDSDVLERPLPPPDLDPTQSGGWVWGLYSDVQLQSFYAEAYGHACVAYDEALESEFGNFSWSMGAGSDGEFGVVGDLSYLSKTAMGGRRPGITTARVPIAQVSEISSRLGPNARVSRNGRALFTRSPDDKSGSWVEDLVRDRPVLRRSAGAFSRSGTLSSSIADYSSHSRPASELAARWIFDDLKAMGIAQGTFPQLDN